MEEDELKLKPYDRFFLLVGDGKPGSKGCAVVQSELGSRIDVIHDRTQVKMTEAIRERFVTLLNFTSDILCIAFREFRLDGFYLPFTAYENIRSNYLNWIFPALTKGVLEETKRAGSSPVSSANFWQQAWFELKILEQDKSNDARSQLQRAFRSVYLVTNSFNQEAIEAMTLVPEQRRRIQQFFKAIRTLAELTESFDMTHVATLILYVSAMEALANSCLENSTDKMEIGFLQRWRNTNPEFLDYPFFTDMFNLLDGIVPYNPPNELERKQMRTQQQQQGKSKSTLVSEFAQLSLTQKDKDVDMEQLVRDSSKGKIVYS